MEMPACQTKAAVVSDALAGDIRTLVLCLQNAFNSREDSCRTDDGKWAPDCEHALLGQRAMGTQLDSHQGEPLRAALTQETRVSR